jgi:predicted amidophosphoribosyltransferase
VSTAVYAPHPRGHLRPSSPQHTTTHVSHFYQVSRWAQQLVDIVLPPRCAGCRRVGHVLCPQCERELVWVAEPICPQCGQIGVEQGMCGRCRRHTPPLQIRAALHFGGSLPPVIHQFKYNKMFGLASKLADLMVQAWPQWAMPATVVVPIPLHPERRRERGYNQSALLAHHLAAQLQLPMREKGLQRIRPTQSTGAAQSGRATEQCAGRICGRGSPHHRPTCVAG